MPATTRLHHVYTTFTQNNLNENDATQHNLALHKIIGAKMTRTRPKPKFTGIYAVHAAPRPRTPGSVTQNKIISVEPELSRRPYQVPRRVAAFNAVFVRVDADHSGELDYEELQRMLGGKPGELSSSRRRRRAHRRWRTGGLARQFCRSRPAQWRRQERCTAQ